MSKTLILTEYEVNLLDLVFTEALSSKSNRIRKYSLSYDGSEPDLEKEDLIYYSNKFIQEVNSLCSKISEQYERQ